MVDLPPLDALRVFDAAARHGSFIAAAAALNITPSAVSHRIRNLEDFLGVPLFHREHRRIVLTEAGKSYAAGIGEALDTVRRATQAVRARPDNAPLMLSLAPAFAIRWLLPRLGRFQERHPDIQVVFTSSVGLIDFSDSDVDLAVRYGRGDWPDVETEWLMSVDSLPVCAPSLMSGPKPLEKPSDLHDHTLLHVITRPDDWRMWLVAAGIDPAEVDPAKGPSFQNLPVALEAAMAGLGVAIADRQIIEADLAAGRLVAPFDIYMPLAGAYYLVRPVGSGRRRDRRVDAFTSWLKQEIAGAGSLDPLH